MLPPARSSLRFLCACSALWLTFSPPLSARGHWTELNIGPFYVDTDGDVSAARDVLTQLEQTRWVLGGLLESKDLPSLWPFRVVLTSSYETNPTGHFVWQNAEYQYVTNDPASLPLGEVAGILLDDNTPRLPADVESGLRQLFSTLKAHGSRVTWGGAPPHPDLAWARMQLMATKFEYSASFHIFLNSLRGSTLPAAEQNAFGKKSAILEQEASANLAQGHWEPVSVSGRPLDPKRDFGEHSRDGTLGEVLAAGRSKSAPALVAEAQDRPAAEALPLLKKAAQLNPRWAEPVFRQAELATDPLEKAKLLREATRLDPRGTQYWIALAKLQESIGEATASQGTWLEAEDSAATEVERERIHQARLDSEQARLDAADEARRRDREAVHLADEHAQKSALDRIRAAEAKANQSTDAQAGTATPENAVPWDQVVAQKKLVGSLVRVDCLHSGSRLWIQSKGKQGQAGATTTELFLKAGPESGLTCGTQTPPRRVTVAYSADSDDQLHTAGVVVSMQVQ